MSHNPAIAPGFLHLESLFEPSSPASPNPNERRDPMLHLILTIALQVSVSLGL